MALAILLSTGIAAVASSASAQTYTLNRSFAGSGVTGTAELVLADSTLAANTSVGTPGSVPAQLVSASLTFNNLGAPATTTFNRSQLSGFIFNRNSAGVITDINFWAPTANLNGYTLAATSAFTTTVAGGGVTRTKVVNSAAAAAAAIAVPTMSELPMILLGLTLAGGAALYIQRRQMSA